MRVFAHRSFHRFARDEDIDDAALWKAAREFAAGQVEADLGRGLFKKRVARRGQGKRGGYRLIVAYKRTRSDRIFFVDAFAKNEKGNLTPREAEALAGVCECYLSADDGVLMRLVRDKKLYEIRRVDNEQAS
ncbi:type II toxin-antitoxin system RelE/ParE family toxin [Desulfolutivibrio sp.]|uniref:type II toxin-antitoxin system RelE/ParE family toxin n=1 Tax=Desulfolutivibrio sp. TaxID=2773296 RepID=UPI002F96909D